MTKLNLKSLILAGISVALLISTSALSEQKRALLHEDGVQRLDVIVDSYSFDPSRIVVKASVPVELNLKSVSGITHNFILSHPGAGLDISKEIPGGKDVTVSFTPEDSGVYSFHCGKQFLFFKSHRERGMTGTLEVVE